MADTSEMLIHLSLSVNKLEKRITEISDKLTKLENFSRLVNMLADDRLTKLEGGKKK